MNKEQLSDIEFHMPTACTAPDINTTPSTGAHKGRIFGTLTAGDHNIHCRCGKQLCQLYALVATNGNSTHIVHHIFHNKPVQDA